MLKKGRGSQCPSPLATLPCVFYRPLCGHVHMERQDSAENRVAAPNLTDLAATLPRVVGQFGGVGSVPISASYDCHNNPCSIARAAWRACKLPLCVYSSMEALYHIVLDTAVTRQASQANSAKSVGVLRWRRSTSRISVSLLSPCLGHRRQGTREKGEMVAWAASAPCGQRLNWSGDQEAMSVCTPGGIADICRLDPVAGRAHWRLLVQ